MPRGRTPRSSRVDSAFHLFSAVPFGPGSPEYLAWMYHGGGLALAREMYAKYGVINIPCAIFPPEASGWFRKEIRTVADLGGLKMRFVGLGANVMASSAWRRRPWPRRIFIRCRAATIDATESRCRVDPSSASHRFRSSILSGWTSRRLRRLLRQPKIGMRFRAHKAIASTRGGDQRSRHDRRRRGSHVIR